MANPYHHALSSVKKWGGRVEDYLPLHQFFDETKSMMPDFRHRAARHHAEGIVLCEKVFGVAITLSDGRKIPTRWVGEQHVKEDLGRIPSLEDWLRCLRPEPWMGRTPRLEVEYAEPEAASTAWCEIPAPAA
jgi:hypothetical protein